MMKGVSMSISIDNIDDTNFDETLASAGVPVLVDFWAEWCGPCKMIAPVLQQVADEYGEKIKVVKVNVENATQVPQKFGIRGIPTLMLFKDGQSVATKVGAVDKSQLVAFLDQNI